MDGLRKELTLLRVGQSTAALLLAAVVACTSKPAQASSDSLRVADDAAARLDSINRAQPGYIVDSIFPIAEEIRRFSAGLSRPAVLEGPDTRGELVRRFTAALQTHDTAALQSLRITRAEFAHLVFPDSPYSREPYTTKPGIIWMQLENESARGLSRLFDRVSGEAYRLSDVLCDSQPVAEGANRYWRNCTMFAKGPTVSGRLRLFGQIVEREGRFKFIAYSTDF